MSSRGKRKRSNRPRSRSKNHAEQRDKMSTAAEAEEAFAKHADYCPLGCGTDYAPGRCKDGDTLAETMDAALDDPA